MKKNWMLMAMVISFGALPAQARESSRLEKEIGRFEALVSSVDPSEREPAPGFELKRLMIGVAPEFSFGIRDVAAVPASVELQLIWERTGPVAPPAESLVDRLTSPSP